tara:strand:+ start:317 stop:1144 length:828 start_codon:yes stop_codon:yes gene_type:complete
MKKKTKTSKEKRTIRKEKERRKRRVYSKRLDKFGKESSFVNQRGSVSPNDTEMFGCEIVRDLPDYVNDFVKQIGYDVVIRVPKQNPNVLTGSGKKGDCHTNSRLMSISFGGNRILGYTIKEEDENMTLFLGHSVWNTPENKTRCVTDYNNGNISSFLFLPVGFNEIDTHKSFMLEDLIITKDIDNSCLSFMLGGKGINDIIREQEKYLVMRKELEIRVEKRGHSFPKMKISKSWSSLIEIQTSNFSKVSSTTGRSWDYYKNKILNTYYPKVKKPL